MAVDDREAADTILLHGAQRLLDRVVCADGNWLAFSQLRHLGRGRVLAVRNALYDDVSVGEHALEPVVIAADGHRTNVEISKFACGVGERVVDGYALRVGRHDLACSGHVFLLLDGGCLGFAQYPYLRPADQVLWWAYGQLRGHLRSWRRALPAYSDRRCAASLRRL